MRTRAPAAVLPIRVAVGWVFLSEGIQKLLRFTRESKADHASTS